MSFYGQSLSYSGTDLFNISTATFAKSVTIFSEESSPTGLAFGDSGTKFYTVGSAGDHVIQHNLSVAYDLSTINEIDSYFNVEAQETAPQDITFNNTGSKMYITGDSGNDITEYSLSTNWDVSSATFNSTFDFEAAVFAFDALPDPNNAQRPNGMTFNDDGFKMYITDRNKDNVYEFDLSSAYDISTTSAVENVLDISGQELNARSVVFNNDGSEMYITGNSGDDINIYTFSSGNEYDLSDATFSSNHSISAQETAPQGMVFNNDGSKYYIIGSNGDDVDEYDLSTNYDFSSESYIGSYIIQSFETLPQDILFNNNGTKMYVVGDSQNKINQHSLSSPYDISTAVIDISYNITSQESQPRGMVFNNDGSKFYITGTNGDEVNEYLLSEPYKLESMVTHLGAFDISLDENNSSSIAFNNDGTLLFILGNTGNDVTVYTLSSGYDLTGIASGPTGTFSVSAQDTAPLGMTFNNDGTSLYVIGNSGNDINEYSLNSAYDLLSVAPTFVQNISVSSEDDLPTGIIFNDTGSKFFISGNRGNDINEYYTLKYNEISASNNGTIDNTNSLIITLTDDTFFASSGTFSDTEVTISNVPEGLTAVLTLNSNTEAELTFTGKANSHIDSDEVVANLSFTFTDAAFTTSNAVDVKGAVGYNDILGFDYIECSETEIVYNGGWTGGSNAGVPDNTDSSLGIRVQGDITITANTNCDCLNVESGQTLTIADGVELTVVNALELDGDLRLLGSAQLMQTHTNTKNASGSGNLYKDVTGTLSNVFQTGYWTSPVTTDGLTYNIAGVLKDGTTPLAATGTPSDIIFSADLDGDDGTSPITLSTRWLSKFINSGAWTTQIDESSELFSPGEGFSKKSTGAVSGQNYTFVGRPNDGDYEHTIDAFGSGTWSLLGNPYPSPIDIDIFTTENSTAITGTIYFYEAGNDTDHYNSNYLGGYASRVAGVGNSASSLGDGTGLKVPGQYVGVGQGFFVEASGTGGTINFNNNTQRAFNTPNVFFSKNQSKENTSNIPILRIGFEFLYNEEIYHRPVSVAFRGLTNNFDKGFEAEMWDYKSTDMALAIKESDLPFSITGIEDFNDSIMIPLKVQTDATREVTFKIDEILNLSTNVFLYDTLTQVYYNITTEKVVVNLDLGVYNNRFFITFKETVLNTEDNKLNEVSIVNKNKQLLIFSNDLLDEVLIYNILGQKVTDVKNPKSLSEIKINTASFQKGIYIVKVKNLIGSFTKKIIIN
ncbi:WD40/YVTN repeat protein-like-containing domain protein [Polaribacter sp. Hel1_85]|nr:WD40/YVTN repeat protein-like-containing domain protein [Polaribacter sp. Hel1_85]